MLNKPPLAYTKGLRLGNMPQIRTVVDEELEQVWAQKKSPKEALDSSVSRGDDCCAASRKRVADAPRGRASKEARPRSFPLQESSMEKRSRFNTSVLPYLLVAPQLAITALFFLWPAGEALWQATQSQDAFGTSSEFVGLANFKQLFNDPLYLSSFNTTLIFCSLVTVSGLVISLLLAACADRVTRGAKAYQTLLIWPYAVAPAIAAQCCGRSCSTRASDS